MTFEHFRIFDNEITVLSEKLIIEERLIHELYRYIVIEIDWFGNCLDIKLYNANRRLEVLRKLYVDDIRNCFTNLSNYPCAGLVDSINYGNWKIYIEKFKDGDRKRINGMIIAHKNKSLIKITSLFTIHSPIVGEIIKEKDGILSYRVNRSLNLINFATSDF